MNHRLRDQEEGQIIPALLLVVVVLLFFGLLFAQVGSAAEQKTQTQTAADSAAVASAHQLRDATVPIAAKTMPYWYGQLLFQSVFVPVPVFPQTACDAAQRNWSSNPHGNTSIDCATSLIVTTDVRAVHIDLTTPRDQVTHGPVDATDERARATATARVSMSHCPQGVFTPLQKAIADWVADRSLMMMGAVGGFGSCLDPAELTMLENLDKNPLTSLAALSIGPPGPILTAVRNGLYAELVD